MRAILSLTAMVTAVLQAARNFAFGGDGANKALAQRHLEDAMLVAAGFKPKEGSDLWKREGVLFGREAALQYTGPGWREHKWRKSSEEA